VLTWSNKTCRIDGGVPAGIFISPSVSGDRAKSVRIKPTTRHGNRRTRANGIENEESPVSRTRRLKNPVGVEATFSVRRGRSSVFFGLSLEVGSLLVISRGCDIAVTWCPQNVHVCCRWQLPSFYAPIRRSSAREDEER
jgi:hypothetical protein